MQTQWLESSPRHDKLGVIARINQLAAAMRARGEQVLFVRHGNDEALPGSAGFQIHPALLVDDGDRIIDKRACDPFADTALMAVLQEIGTNTLYVCGLATEFCVDSALRAALSRGFDVVALADAHTTGDRPHLQAGAIVEHHNWVWANLAVPHGRTVRVEAVAAVLAATTRAP